LVPCCASIADHHTFPVIERGLCHCAFAERVVQSSPYQVYVRPAGIFPLRAERVCNELVTGAEHPVKADCEAGGKGLAAAGHIGKVSRAAFNLPRNITQGDATLRQKTAQLLTEVRHRAPITWPVFPLFPGLSRETGNSSTLPSPAVNC